MQRTTPFVIVALLMATLSCLIACVNAESLKIYGVTHSCVQEEVCFDANGWRLVSYGPAMGTTILAYVDADKNGKPKIQVLKNGNVLVSVKAVYTNPDKMYGVKESFSRKELDLANFQHRSLSIINYAKNKHILDNINSPTPWQPINDNSYMGWIATLILYTK